jgi:hypothetical protein
MERLVSFLIVFFLFSEAPCVRAQPKRHTSLPVDLHTCSKIQIVNGYRPLRSVVVDVNNIVYVEPIVRYEMSVSVLEN